MSELELILAKLKLVSEEEVSGYYLCDKEHSKILLDEIERLKKREQKCIDHYLVQCRYASEMEDKYITSNYIINELEKWLRSEIKRLEDIQNPKKGIKPYGQEYNNYTLIIGAYNNILDKLQELKGVDKE